MWNGSVCNSLYFLMANLLEKKWFSDRAFHVTTTDAEIGSLISKVSPYIIW